MLKMASLVVLVGGCLLASAPGCRRHDAAEQVTAPARQGAGRMEPVALDLSPGEAAAPTRFRNDALWQRARGSAEIDLMRLANREGAMGLLEGLNVGRSVGLTALAALPHADDAELALDRLCELLARESESTSEKPVSLPVLRSVHGIVARPPRQREALARNGYAGCVPVVTRLARLPKLDAERHDLASSTAGLLLEHRNAARR